MKTIRQISVRALVEYVLASGDLGGGEFVGPNRATEGSRIHRKIQRSRPEEYRAEVPVAHQVETDHFVLKIGGRIDGVFEYPDQIIIEEIKSTTTHPNRLTEEGNQVHWGQLKTYAYFYASDHNLEEIDTQLTYYHLETGAIKEFRRHFTRDELADFFRDILTHYLEWALTLEQWAQLRDDSIRELEFPYPSYRQGQRKMAVDVYVTIREKGQLLVQAPTGIGKTMAALFPAIKAMGEGLTAKLFYLTARTTGRVAAEQALDTLRSKGLKIKSLTLTAKEKICFCPDAACNGDECRFARGYFDRISEAVKDAFHEDALTRTTIETYARQHTVCPFEFSLDISLWVDCIICDYNYAFDPRVYLKRFFLETVEEYTFLVDESHNLVDRAREMFSATLCKQPFLDLRRAVKAKLPKLHHTMGKINTHLLQARKRCEAENGEYADQNPPGELLPVLETFVEQAEQWLVRNLQTPFRDALLDLYFEANWFMRIADGYDERYATCAEQIDRDVRLKLFCLDPSEKLRNALQRCRSAIFFSATMTPIVYFQQIFGCEPTARSRVLPSPFPREHLCLLIANRISTLYKHRNNTIPQVTRAILTLVQQKPGNYLLFFPSYQYMRMIHETFTHQCPETDVMLQTPGMSEDEREQFLDRFAHDNPETLVGFAVMGGIFGEGIDLVGDRLTGAVIVGVGLPGICLERNLIRDYFARVHNAGFEFAYMYPGINRVLQAAGRVIRTETDRGVVLLIDQRFATFRYRTLLPQEWQPVNVQTPRHVSQIIQQFWEQ